MSPTAFSPPLPPPPLPHVQLRETMAQQLGGLLRTCCRDSWWRYTEGWIHHADIESHLFLAKGKSMWGPAKASSSCIRNRPQSLGGKAGLWQFMMPAHVAGGERETRWRNHPGFLTVSLLFFWEFESCTPSSISDKTPLLFLYCRLVLFLIKHLWFINVGVVHLRLFYIWLSRYIIYGKCIFMI